MHSAKRNRSSRQERDFSARRRHPQKCPSAPTGPENPKRQHNKARQQRAKFADLHKVPDSQTGWWRTQSQSNPSPTPKFPANREINREFFNFGPDRGSEV